MKRQLGDKPEGNQRSFRSGRSRLHSGVRGIREHTQRPAGNYGNAFHPVAISGLREDLIGFAKSCLRNGENV